MGWPLPMVAAEVVGVVEEAAKVVTAMVVMVMVEVVPGMGPVLRVPDQVMAAAMVGTGQVELVPVVMEAGTAALPAPRVDMVVMEAVTGEKAVTVRQGMEEKVMEKPAMQMMAMVDMMDLRLGIILPIPVVLLQKAGLSVR